MKKRLLSMLMLICVLFSGCSKGSGVNGDKEKSENKILRKASKEVEDVCWYYYAYDLQIIIDKGEYYGVPCLYYKAKPIDFDNCSKKSVRKLCGDFTDDGNFLDPEIVEEMGKKYVTASFFPKTKFWIKDEKTIIDVETNTEYIKGAPK